MNDFYFENELRNRIRQEQYNKTQSDFGVYLKIVQNGTVSYLNDIRNDFLTIFDIYVEDKYGEDIENHYNEEYDKFEKAVSNERLVDFSKEYKFSEEEVTYLKLCISKEPFESIKYIIKILFRAKVLEYFGKNYLIDLINRRQDLMNRYKVNTKKYSAFLSEEMFGVDLDKRFEEEINRKTEYDFNDKINCGGYALKIDREIYVLGKNFPEKVTSILERFPFTRLLGDSNLDEDEYLVIYRATNDDNIIHHFIRVDDDGVVREKNGNQSVGIFNSWSNDLENENTGEAVFAVKKEHKMFDVERNDNNKKIYDFPEKVKMAIEEKTNLFEYHGHNFRFKKSPEDDILILDEKGNFIAYVIVGDGECLVDVEESKIRYVENVDAKAKPIIKNGILINYEEITGRRILQKEHAESRT